MKKNTYTIFLLILILGVIVFFIYFMVEKASYYQEQNRQLTPDYQILCESLKPDMSETDVLAALRQIGDFSMNRGEWSGGLIEIGIKFKDPAIDKIYGYFDLLFIDNKLSKVAKSDLITTSGEKPIVICDYSKFDD